jgi:hypothetical protein
MNERENFQEIDLATTNALTEKALMNMQKEEERKR